MSRYVIERDIPAIGTAEREALRDAAHHSNAVLAAMQAEQKHIQWEHSYVAADKTFCIYLADNEALCMSMPGAVASRLPGSQRSRR
jgi:Protein of unknown function (DUF4242)